MKRLMLLIVVLGIFGFSVSAQSQVFITELADPNNEAGLRFVELYNAGTAAVDFSEGSGWVLNKYTNASATISQTLALTGSIAAGGTYVIAAGVSDADFEAGYGVTADLFDGEDNHVAGSNGDDNIELVDGSGTVVDLFGVPGEDGTGTNHEFEDGRAVRIATITTGSATWDVAEWKIDSDAPSGIGPVDAPDGFDPHVWPTPDPLLLISAFSVSDVDIEVVYSKDAGTVDVANYSLTGTAGVTFASATKDAADPSLVHLVASAPIAGDAVLDNLADAGLASSVDLYAGITPIAYTNAVNPGGTIEPGIPATFAGLITANDAYNNVWVNDGNEAYMGAMIFSYDFDALVAVGDEIMFTAELDTYYNLTELTNPVLLGTIATGSPTIPAMISGADIDSSLAADTNPAEQWEGQLVKIVGATVLAYNGTDYNYQLTDDDGTTKFLVGDNVDYHLGAVSLDIGSTYDIVGVVDYSYGVYRINPRGMDDVKAPAMVHFEVNMAHQIMNANFDAASDYVDIAGDMNGWGPGAGEWQLTAHPDTAGIWVGDFPMDPGEYGFKFRINSSWDAGQHDGGDNRTLVVGEEGGHYFGYLDNFTMYPVIFFGVDLTDKFNLGEFDPTTDSVNVTGSFTDWSADAGIDLHPMPGDDLRWGAYVDQAGFFTAGDALDFKFRINQVWGNNESNPTWAGDNRHYTVEDGLQEYKVYWNDYDYNMSVTFEVNMNAKMAAGEFDPATQYVDIAGTFNGWGPATGEWQLSDDDADGIWSITVVDSFVVGQELEFKFRIDSGTWESISDRKYIVGGGAQTYSVWWNDFDPNFVGAPVTFQVNMNAQITATAFDAAVDKVFLTSALGPIEMGDGDTDGIYDVTVDVPVGVTFYHYRINADGDEVLPHDRQVIVEVPDTPLILGVVWFGDIEVVRNGSGTITFRVDMTVLESLGFYSRELGDSLELRGGFNDWGGDPNRALVDMIRQPGAEIYFLTVPYEGDNGEGFPYKFFLNLHQIAGGDSARHAGEDFYEYELPAGAGGGDRFFVWDGLDGDHVLPVQTFQDYVTEGVIADGETVHATLYMDMTDAVNYEDDPFDPATDSLFFVWQDAWGAELQGLAAGNVADGFLYESTWKSRTFGPNVLEVTIPITGPAPHALIYTAEYVKPDGGGAAELGGATGFGRYRTQWLKPLTVGGDIASVQALELVRFSNAGTPLEVMPEPYANNLVATYPVSVDEPVGLPSAYVLSQNYPNPFNPTTTISYVLPEAVDVDLIVFDITGREVTRLVDNRKHTAGRYDIMWNGLNADGEKLASGMYFYRIIAGDFQQTNKMLMLK